MKQTILRNLLLLDAVVLFLLGLLLIFVPQQVAQAFAFKELPGGVSYIIGMLGCVLASLSPGYVMAAKNPARHVIWIQVGILRGAAECILGLVCVARGGVTFQQASLGIVVAGMLALAYAVLYPRKPRLVRDGKAAGAQGAKA